MTASTPHCEGCGSALPSANAVCAHCEAELSAKSPEPTGKYVCPCCDQRFAKPAQVLWPTKVPWWRPTTICMQCPRCDTPLNERHKNRPVELWFILGIGAAYVVHATTAHRLRAAPMGLFLAAYFLWYFKTARRAARDPQRFVARWLRDVRDLQPDSKHAQPPGPNGSQP